MNTANTHEDTRMDKQVKVGDKVKATDKASGWSDITPGNVYEVQNVYGETVEILDDVSDHNVLTGGEYELVPQPQEFKAGDRVRIVKKVGGKNFYWNAEEMDKRVGRTGTVQGGITPNNGSLPVRTDGDGEGLWYYLPESLELVTEDAQPEPQDIYLISGFSSEFPTLEAAEQRLTDGHGLHGEEYRIAKLVKTVRVSRVTTTTLEAV